MLDRDPVSGIHYQRRDGWDLLGRWWRFFTLPFNSDTKRGSGRCDHHGGLIDFLTLIARMDGLHT